MDNRELTLVPSMVAVPERTESPLDHALQRVGDRWTMLVIDALQEGPRRFNELLESVQGIAPNILSQRLKHLEREGIVVGRPYSIRPRRLSYELSAAGRELAGTLRLLAQWGATGSDQPGTVAHRACGTPMEARWYCPTCATAVLDDEENEDLRYV